jgi:hypothetical protein
MNTPTKEPGMAAVITQRIKRDVRDPTRKVLRPYGAHRCLRFISKVKPNALFLCHFITKLFSITYIIASSATPMKEVFFAAADFIFIFLVCFGD